ncbi:histone-lysine N-methyltransferase SETMAR [Nephila pilipes]|uniref:Histone-lysine N-methyltransferase SETMAR n=1 Tax=Nephila pilipes TaxID=299642 RepID=A0A8X6JVR1_NEPPI|nr:histone-lysine N-methyltransferase SETMAR [Nephila pilipes]
MHQKLQPLCPALFNRKGLILVHDNTIFHVSQMTARKFNELRCETLPHLVYSLDLSPTAYYFFKHIDSFLQKNVFNNQAATENAFEEFIGSPLQNSKKSESIDLFLVGKNT